MSDFRQAVLKEGSGQMQVILGEGCLSALLQAARVCLDAKVLIQENAKFCLYFSSFLCTAVCILKTEFYADVNNIIFYFPVLLKSAATQNQCYFDTTEKKVVTVPSAVVLTLQFS